jgi:hypothetical protein|tara:strand:- start:81 stop:434 length:354 start_codon:yes stop_codon:yes gene_type:complete
MAQLNTKVKLYLEANSKTEEELFNGNIQLENIGAGDYIKVWNVSGVAKPTDSQLNSYETAGNTDEKNRGVRATRRNAYGSIGDQLDLLYKDMLAGKGDSTGEWFKSIKAVKDANAKE